jgi:pyruvate dehydrogenase E2 component (dihydrolipoamide acetyltransferase)
MSMSAAIFPVTMPKWGIEMQEGTITDWHVAVGQSVAKDTPLLDVETDKIVNTVESPVAGTLRRIVVEKGDTLAVGALLAVYADSSVDESAIDAFIAAFRPADASFEPAAEAPPAAPASAPANAAASAVAEAPRSGDAEALVSPIAKRLAEKLGIDLATIVGTGPNGRISKEDVEAAAARQSAAAAGAASAGSRTRMSATRLAIARRLVESKQTIPHYRLETTVHAGRLVAERRSLAAAGTKVSINDLIVGACGRALVRHPVLNAHCVGEEVITFADADICIAVATEQGLLTPVVRHAQSRSAAEIAAAATDLAARARAGTLRREEVSGGTFTVSNLGMYGLESFDAIINPPQVAILAVGAVRDAVLVDSGQPVVAPVVTLTLSCDHRVVDGAEGAKFLATLRQLLEQGA